MVYSTASAVGGVGGDLKIATGFIQHTTVLSLKFRWMLFNKLYRNRICHHIDLSIMDIHVDLA